MNEQIQQIIQQIINNFQPEKIILFGSYAYGNPSDDSDVDLLVIMDFNDSPQKQMFKILQSIDYHLPLDLIVRSQNQLSKRINAGDFFLKEILERGRILYDRNIS